MSGRLEVDFTCISCNCVLRFIEHKSISSSPFRNDSFLLVLIMEWCNQCLSKCLYKIMVYAMVIMLLIFFVMKRPWFHKQEDIHWFINLYISVIYLSRARDPQNCSRMPVLIFDSWSAYAYMRAGEPSFVIYTTNQTVPTKHSVPNLGNCLGTLSISLYFYI